MIEVVEVIEEQENES
jgi:hypothetical protein